MPTNDPNLLILRNAAENASTDPITDAQIVAILRGEGTNQSHLRAIFGDVSLPSLYAAAAYQRIPHQTLLQAYRAARDTAAAANPALDAALLEGW